MTGGGATGGVNWFGVSILLGAILVALVIITMLMDLVGGPDASPSPTTSARPSAGASGSVSPTASADGSAKPSASSKPSAQASASPASASPSPGTSASPSPSGSPSPAAACSGNEDNQRFYAGAAAGLRFDVYCAVLPSGWRISSGSWSGTSGGMIEVLYKGPNGATLQLSQGAVCGDDECPDATPNLGSASFGNLDGSLVETDDGFAVVVDGSAPTYYVATTTGLDEGETRDVAEALVVVPS